MKKLSFLIATFSFVLITNAGNCVLATESNTPQAEIIQTKKAVKDGKKLEIEQLLQASPLQKQNISQLQWNSLTNLPALC